MDKKFLYKISLASVLIFNVSAQGQNLFAQEIETIGTQVIADVGIMQEPAKVLTSQELVRLSWAASSKRNKSELERLVNQCVTEFGAQAQAQQKNLKAFPQRGEEVTYQQLNDVGTCLFIQAEAVMNSGQAPEAIVLFENIIKTYPWAQAWDPRGWFWSVAEKSQASINVLTGKAEEEAQQKNATVVRTRPELHTVGTKAIIDYTKYGRFENVGKSNYHYRILDRDGLAKALGEGIYPNIRDVYKNPAYKAIKKTSRLDGNHWDFMNTDDLEAAYFKWVKAPEPWGVRLFYIGMIFEKSGLYLEALKAYQSLVINFPQTVAWTYWQTPWYPGQAAVAKIRHILRIHPELGIKEKWMSISVENGFDNDVKNDVIVTYPGKLEKKTFFDNFSEAFWPRKVKLGRVKKRLGEGKVRLVQYENGHWQLLVERKPYVIKGITYAPTKIGQSPDKGTLANWMEEDTNNNGRLDGPYDAWVDYNRNNQQDSDELVIGDFQLIKDMGANTLRIYHQPDMLNKDVLRDMYERYGLRVIMGDFLGKYTLGSGADWFEGTDYENPEHKRNMMASVKKMVLAHKDEPYLLLWLLGNENNYGVACNADKKPEAYFKFVNEVARMIKSIDPDHPVAINNGDTLFLDIFAQYAPDIDIFTANVYRGNYGFGSFWEQVEDAAQRPAFITEYGAPAYAHHLTLEEAEEAQADYHYGNWLDIAENLAGTVRGSGNALGGVVFEWLDEWWKNYEPYLHDRKSDAVGPFPGGYYFEEWFGIIGQGNGRHSPFMRQLRKSYDIYKKLWN